VAFSTAPADSSGRPRRTPWNEASMSMRSSMSWRAATGVVGETALGELPAVELLWL
jgi:hypothetical protein